MSVYIYKFRWDRHLLVWKGPRNTWCLEGWLCPGVMQRKEEGFNQKPLAETFGGDI